MSRESVSCMVSPNCKSELVAKQKRYRIYKTKGHNGSSVQPCPDVSTWAGKTERQSCLFYSTRRIFQRNYTPRKPTPLCRSLSRRSIPLSCTKEGAARQRKDKRRDTRPALPLTQFVSREKTLPSVYVTWTTVNRATLVVMGYGAHNYK